MVTCCSFFTTQIASFFTKTKESISWFFGAKKQVTYYTNQSALKSDTELPSDIQKLILSYLPPASFKGELKTYLKRPSVKRKENLLWLFKSISHLDASAMNFYPKRVCLKLSHRVKKASLCGSLYCNLQEHHKEYISRFYDLVGSATHLDLSSSFVTNDDFERLVHKTSALFSLKLYCSIPITPQNIRSLLKHNPQLTTLDIAGTAVDLKEITSGTIRKLNISGNPCIDDKALQTIGNNMPCITHLGLSSLPLLTNESSASFAAFTNLISLNLSNNPQLTDTFFSTTFPLEQQIKELAIGNSRTVKFTKKAFKIWLERFCELQELVIQAANLDFGDEEMLWIASLFPKLESLSLRNVTLCTDKGFLGLKHLSHLCKVEMSGTLLISKDAETTLRKTLPRLICHIKNSFHSPENHVE